MTTKADLLLSEDRGALSAVKKTELDEGLKLRQIPLKGRKDELVSFFAFPKDPLLKKRWLVAIKRDEGKLFAVTKHTKVCSTHFANDDYLPNVVGGRRYLRVDAVPSVFAFRKPQRPARRKPRDRQQCVSRAHRLSAIGQAGSSELALETTLSPRGDVAVSRNCATADEALDATECSDSASVPTSATNFQERQEVCGCTCAATVVNLEEQLSEHQVRIRQLESDLEGRTEEVKCASASAARVPALEMQLSLLQVHVQQLKSDLEARTKESLSLKRGDAVFACAFLLAIVCKLRILQVWLDNTNETSIRKSNSLSKCVSGTLRVVNGVLNGSSPIKIYIDTSAKTPP
ncbi:hypothetical protein MTO96_006833 [Rhipicephalus appendiculatus]